MLNIARDLHKVRTHIRQIAWAKGRVHTYVLYDPGHPGKCEIDTERLEREFGALKRPGLFLGSFITFYGFARITGEFFREPDPQLGFLWGGLTMGMLLSVPMIIVGAVIMMLAWRRKAPTRAADPI